MNYYAWSEWISQHSGRGMYLVFLALTLYVPIGLLAGYQILKLQTQNPLVKLIGVLFISIGMMGVLDLIANVDPPFCECPGGRNIHYSEWFAWWFWMGKLVLNIPVIILWRRLQNPKSH